MFHDTHTYKITISSTGIPIEETEEKKRWKIPEQTGVTKPF